MEAAKEAKSGQESSHALDKDKLERSLSESVDQLTESKKTNEELKLRCSEYEAKIAEQDHMQN